MRQQTKRILQGVLFFVLFIGGVIFLRIFYQASEYNSTLGDYISNSLLSTDGASGRDKIESPIIQWQEAPAADDKKEEADDTKVETDDTQKEEEQPEPAPVRIQTTSRIAPTTSSTVMISSSPTVLLSTTPMSSSSTVKQTSTAATTTKPPPKPTSPDKRNEKDTAMENDVKQSSVREGQAGKLNQKETAPMEKILSTKDAQRQSPKRQDSIKDKTRQTTPSVKTEQLPRDQPVKDRKRTTPARAPTREPTRPKQTTLVSHIGLIQEKFHPHFQFHEDEIHMVIDPNTMKMTTGDFDFLERDYYRYLARIQFDCRRREAAGREHMLAGNEGWEVCLDPPYNLVSDNCVVFSFGITNDRSFENYMRRQGCQIQTFDSKVRFQVGRNHGEPDAFRVVTLSGKTDAKLNTATLGTIIKQSHNENNNLDYIKLDIGWNITDVIPTAVQEGSLKKVKQIGVKLCSKPSQTIAKVLEMLYKQGFRIFYTYFHDRTTSYDTGRTIYECLEVHFVNTNFLKLKACAVSVLGSWRNIIADNVNNDAPGLFAQRRALFTHCPGSKGATMCTV